MPELPDIAAYITALEPRIVGQPLEHVRLQSAFLLRTAQPPLADVEGRVVRELRRIGKRIAIGVDNDLWLVLHLMIAGRLHWRAAEAKLAGRQTLAAFDFPERIPGSYRGRLQAPRVTARRARARRICVPSTPEASTSSPAISIHFVPHSPPKTTHSSARSPIRVY